ncbi:MAG: serine/threonine-protein kinase [Leifsonia sp.]
MRETLVGERYALTAPIARGGMSIVYSAHDRVLDREVAIKFLIGDGGSDACERAEREMRLAGDAHHPALVDVLDAGFTTWMGAPVRYLVMQRVAAPSLQQLLADGRPDTVLVAEIAAQIADALASLHLRGVLHLDVKPGNILVESAPTLGFSRRVRLIDFGLAQRVDAAPRLPGSSIVATAAYMSPEHVAGRALTGASDVYSLGLVLLRCLTGHDEFPGTRAASAVARLARDPEIPDGLPAGWSSVLSAMTIRTPASRPTAHDVAAEFVELRPARARRDANEDRRHHGTAAAAFTRLRSRMHLPHPASALATAPLVS